MDIIKKSLDLGKTIRNAARMKEIVYVFAKHGFDEFFAKQLNTLFPDFILPKARRTIKAELKENPNSWNQIIGQRLRLCFEELGPSFVKLGQLLSSREDIFDEAFILEMKKLRDSVKGLDFSVVKEELEKTYDKDISDIFESIDSNPIGTASIGVVYGAKLVSGEEVVIKLRRPNIKKNIEVDFDILIFLMGRLGKISEEIQKIRLDKVLEDFLFGLKSELNFYREALNGKRLADLYKKNDTGQTYYFPKVYDQLTKENVLVLERLRGTSFNDPKILDVFDKNLEEHLLIGVKIFVQTFLQDGFYHADLHGGNFFLLDDKRIAIIDYGLMGTLSLKSRQSFIALIYSIINHNYENLVYEFLDVANYDKLPNITEFIGDVKTALSPYVGLTVNQVNFNDITHVLMKTLYRHQVYLPNDWYMIFRAMMSLDGVGKSLKMDLDLYSLLENDVNDLVKNSFDKSTLIQESIWSARDLLSMVRLIPRHVRWFTREWSKKNYAIEIIHRGHEKSLGEISQAIKYLATAFLTGVLLYIGTNLIPSSSINQVYSWPYLSYVFYILAVIVALIGFRKKKVSN